VESGKEWSGEIAGYRTALSNVARYICHDKDAREDLIQDTFVRALQARSAPTGNTLSWLITILRNALIDKGRRQRPDLVPLAEDTPAMAPEPDPPWCDVSIENVKAVVAALPRELREPFEMHYIDGDRYKDVAAKLDIPPNTVATRLLRARKAIRKALFGDRVKRRSK
jgi:RNA polymerase sigma-70 factor, ECF subfamily